MYFSVNEDTPPTLQWYNKRTSKRCGSKKDRGRSPKRVVVGRNWLQQNMPREYATLCGLRVLSGTHEIKQLTTE